MTGQEILAGLIPVMSEVTCVPERDLTMDSRFGDLGADSLSIAEIAVSAQDLFGTEIPDGELGGLETVRDLVGCVSRRLREPRAAGAR